MNLGSNGNKDGDLINHVKRARIGPAGWSYKDWDGIVYPPSPGRGFDQLAFIAGLFDTVEVNSSFYRTPPPTHSSSWLRRTSFNPEFRFTTKLFRGFTHDRELPPAEEARAFRRYLDPLQEDGRLGALLIQFPWSFKDGPEARRRLERVLDLFREYPNVVEVRHSSFAHDGFLRFLEDHSAGIAAIDQPLFHDSIRPEAMVAGGPGYVRFHGRNYEKWFNHEESWERYDYLYTPEELEPWVERIGAMAATRDAYVITNNHFRGQAVVNAIDLKRSLGQPVRVPETLLQVFAERGLGKE